MARVQRVLLAADVAAVTKALRSLAEIAKISPEPVQDLFAGPDVVSRLFRGRLEITREGRLTVVLELTDRLRNLLADYGPDRKDSVA